MSQPAAAPDHGSGLPLSIRPAHSPNQDARPAGMPIDTLVLHYTGMRSAAEAIARLRDPAARVSSHYVVEEHGQLWQLVPDVSRAFHAGVSWWRGHGGLNDRSIGIEIVNPGHEHGYRDFPALQMAVVCDLCLTILSRHPIPPRNVVAHSDIAPDRKQDPGERFDWRGLAQSGVGLWPEGVPDLGTTGMLRDAAALRDVRAALARSAIAWHRKARSSPRSPRSCAPSSGTGGRKRSPARRTRDAGRLFAMARLAGD